MTPHQEHEINAWKRGIIIYLIRCNFKRSRNGLSREFHERIYLTSPEKTQGSDEDDRFLFRRALQHISKLARRALYAFPPDLIPKLYEVTKDRRIFDFFLHPSGFVAMEDPDGKGRELVEKMLKDLKELWEFMDFEKK